jgi:hypothetical protein
MIALKSSGIIGESDLGNLALFFLLLLHYNASDTGIVTGTIERAVLCRDMGTARARDMRRG